jgi:hypothetical protein
MDTLPGGSTRAYLQQAAERRARLRGIPTSKHPNLPTCPAPVRSATIIKIDDGAEWRPCAAAPLYEVSSDGRVRHAQTKHVLKTCLDRYGAPKVSLYLKTSSVSQRVASLVAAAFIGPRLAHYGVRYLDGDKKNVRADNLSYSSKRRYSRLGESNPHAKFNAAKVAEMRATYARGGTSYRKLAVQYGTSPGNVCKIITGQTWRLEP